WGERETKDEMLWYACILVALTLLPVAFAAFGTIYVVSALALDLALLHGVWRVRRAQGPEWTGAAWKLYKFSLLYLALLFAAMVIDRRLPL
ncbi:MAG: heme o synthase, partial [Gemmatimonadaceae bacterium]